MHNFPECFIGETLAEQNLRFDGLDTMSLQQIDELKDTLCQNINTDDEYMVFMQSSIEPHGGGTQFYLKAQKIVVPEFSKAQLSVLKIILYQGVVDSSSLNKASLNVLIRMGAVQFSESEQNKVVINSNIKHFL